MEAISTALTTALSGVATECMSVASSVVPVALPIVGIGIVIAVGVRIFKKVTGK